MLQCHFQARFDAPQVLWWTGREVYRRRTSAQAASSVASCCASAPLLWSRWAPLLYAERKAFSNQDTPNFGRSFRPVTVPECTSSMAIDDAIYRQVVPEKHSLEYVRF